MQSCMKMMRGDHNRFIQLGSVMQFLQLILIRNRVNISILVPLVPIHDIPHAYLLFFHSKNGVIGRLNSP